MVPLFIFSKNKPKTNPPAFDRVGVNAHPFCVTPLVTNFEKIGRLLF